MRRRFTVASLRSFVFGLRPQLSEPHLALPHRLGERLSYVFALGLRQSSVEVVEAIQDAEPFRRQATTLTQLEQVRNVTPVAGVGALEAWYSLLGLGIPPDREIAASVLRLARLVVAPWAPGVLANRDQSLQSTALGELEGRVELSGGRRTTVLLGGGACVHRDVKE